MFTTFEISTNDYKQLDAYAALNRDMESMLHSPMLIDPIVASEESAATWSGAASGFASDNLCAMRMNFAPHRVAPRHGTARSRWVIISIVKNGKLSLSQDGHLSETGANQMVLIEPSRPFMFESSLINITSILVPRSTFCAVVPDLDRYTAQVFPLDTCAGQMLMAMTDQLGANFATIDGDSLDLVTDALIKLTAAAMTRNTTGLLSALSRQTLVQRHRIRRYISDHLTDAKLSPTTIAQGVNLSLRSVYRAFSDNDETIMDIIKMERLMRCKADLACTTMQRRSVGEIAADWGFGSLAHFSRAFRQAYGCSPREFRASLAQNALLH